MSTSAEIQVGTAIFFQDADGEPKSICPFLLEQIEDAKMLAEQAGVESLDAHRLLLMLLREDITLSEVNEFHTHDVDYEYKITPTRKVFWRNPNGNNIWVDFEKEETKEKPKEFITEDINSGIDSSKPFDADSWEDAAKQLLESLNIRLKEYRG